ncbi:MAG TPA: glycoside hydrolase family 9 protein, partial [Vicinamibacteria bacterium]|nr:glycoside hydrolase family 9 protein [Vicinamibacteria bacterium]
MRLAFSWRSRRGLDSAATTAATAAVLAVLLCSCGTSAAAASARAARSDAVKVDQVGYPSSRPKLAVITDARASGTFSVRRVRDGSEAMSGALGPARADADTGDTVRIADLSAVTDTGSYYVDVAGVGTSDEFDVSPDVYSSAFVLAARAFYGQRCGTAVDLGPSFPGYRHAACHVAGAPNPDALMHVSSGATGTIEASGGWHDAGDYGKYVVNSGISTGELLWAYEMFPDRVGPVSLSIPESGNATPDLLDEARWNLTWMLKMQDADGGVWHKLTSENFGGFVMPEVDDGGPRYVIGTGAGPYKSSCATADFAAVMAIAARVFRTFDPAFAAAAQSAAERAWSWLSRYPNVTFKNCCGVVTGEYGDGDCSDERLWAAAELFRTTGGAEYNAYFVSAYAGSGALVADVPSWQNVRTMALMTYALSRTPGTDESVRARVRGALVDSAHAVVARAAANPYRVSLRDTDYVWGSNGVAANYGVVLIVANALQPEPAFVD